MLERVRGKDGPLLRIPHGRTIPTSHVRRQPYLDTPRQKALAGQRPPGEKEIRQRTVRNRCPLFKEQLDVPVVQRLTVCHG